MKTKYFIAAVMLMLLSYPMLSLSASQAPNRVQPGDTVLVDVSCRLPNGELLFTTLKRQAEDPSIKRSKAFIPMKFYEPFELIAGNSVKHDGKDLIDNGLAGALADKLALAVVGLPLNGTNKLILNAAPDRTLSQRDRYLKRATFLRRARDIKVPKTAFIERFGHEPSVGMFVDPSPPLRYAVKSIERETVHCRLITKEGAVIDTPFGPGALRYVDEKDYKIELHLEKGRLVRTGHLIGRIDQIEGQTFTIDFGYLSGGEPLHCEISLSAGGA